MISLLVIFDKFDRKRRYTTIDIDVASARSSMMEKRNHGSANKKSKRRILGNIFRLDSSFVCRIDANYQRQRRGQEGVRKGAGRGQAGGERRAGGKGVATG